MNLKIKVSEIMSTALITVLENTTLKELKELFKRRGIHHILVENKSGELKGIISSEDLSRITYVLTMEEKVLASHLMTKDPVKISADTPVKKVIDHFLDKRFRALPVVNTDNVSIGIVTPYDILLKLAESS